MVCNVYYVIVSSFCSLCEIFSIVRYCNIRRLTFYSIRIQGRCLRDNSFSRANAAVTVNINALPLVR